MTNEELIDALRNCACIKNEDHCKICGYRHSTECGRRIADDAADALEAAEKRIERLEEDLKTREAEREVMQDTIKICEEAADRYKAQLPKEGEWIEKWRFKTDGTPFHKIGDMECSVCHGDMLGRFYSKYCPHCGALLRGEHDERTDKA